ncbi:putative serine/threonine-protein kinase pats1 isoform X1 [Acropora palmata]|uniref:putative serine/threonine-protein kinase pats1 isoform X1 n=1 Tax=Acropora palmata TaxID=6131 RepID=UPI003DA07FA0
MQKECSEVQRLRKCILDVIEKLPHRNEYIPIKWLRYEKALKVVLDEGHKRITFEHARWIAYEVCHIHDYQEFLTVLVCFHDQRIIIHFDDTDELNKLVVLDPQWLIDVFKKVITVKRFDRIESGGFKNLWLKLEREGILEEKLLKHMWGSLTEEHHTFESLIATMEKFSLLCPWSLSVEPYGEKYLVPSMLRWYPPQEITKLITSARLPSLFVKFESGHSPSNLFPRLVVQFLQWGRKKCWSIVDPHLYKNFFRFYTEDKNCSVVLLCHSYLTEVVVHAGNVLSLRDDSQANLGNSPTDQRGFI